MDLWPMEKLQRKNDFQLQRKIAKRKTWKPEQTNHGFAKQQHKSFGTTASMKTITVCVKRTASGVRKNQLAQ
jgi:hypothetical protein